MSLKLGCADKGAIPGDQKAFFVKFHEAPMLPQGKFRGEADNEWIPFSEAVGVKDLQTDLRNFGFLTKGPIDGVFGYRTLGAVRLFQEYVRNYEGLADIGKPSGIVDEATAKHIARWKSGGKKCDWAATSPTAPTDDFKRWLSLLEKIKARGPATKALQVVQNFSGKSDTLKVTEWDLNPAKIHLIGVRRKEWVATDVRANDDIFILLINGMTFKFVGSVDPNEKIAARGDEPFIAPGQHKYRFGWHKQSDMQRVYRAWKPATDAVLAFRDVDDDDTLTDQDLEKGLHPNNSINIHWSGIGTSNWSAGCQVISGKKYMNHKGAQVDCSPYAAVTYGDLAAMTKGAYNVMLDLIMIYADKIGLAGDLLYYTLIYEKDLDLDPNIGVLTATEILQAIRE